MFKVTIILFFLKGFARKKSLNSFPTAEKGGLGNGLDSLSLLASFLAHFNESRENAHVF